MDMDGWVFSVAPATLVFRSGHGSAERKVTNTPLGPLAINAAFAVVAGSTVLHRFKPRTNDVFTRTRSGAAIILSAKQFIPLTSSDEAGETPPPPPPPEGIPQELTGLYVAPYISLEIAKTTTQEVAVSRANSVASHVSHWVDVDVGAVAGYRLPLWDSRFAVEFFLGGFFPILSQWGPAEYHTADTDPDHAKSFITSVNTYLEGVEPSPLAWDHGKLLATLPYLRGGIHFVFTL